MEKKLKKTEKAVVVRSHVEPKAKYRDYQETLRFDFYYSCAYCTMMESEAQGIGFNIVHYYPQRHYPALAKNYNNLMWACERCNRYKSDFHPDANDVEKGFVVLRPDQDDPREHYEPRKYRIVGNTPTGEFNIDRLNLNRLHLRRLREIRERLWSASEYLAYGVYELLNLRFDRLRPDKRSVFLRIRRNVEKRALQVGDKLETLVRDFAQSPLLGEDPEKTKQVKRRKEFLRKEKAIMPDELPGPKLTSARKK